MVERPKTDAKGRRSPASTTLRIAPRRRLRVARLHRRGWCCAPPARRRRRRWARCVVCRRGRAASRSRRARPAATWMPKPATSAGAAPARSPRAPTSRRGTAPIIGNALIAADARDLDDVARALRAHDRQRRLRDPQRAEDVGLQLRAHLGLGQLLDHAEVPVARVVDDDVERPKCATPPAPPRQSRRRGR